MSNEEKIKELEKENETLKSVSYEDEPMKDFIIETNKRKISELS